MRVLVTRPQPQAGKWVSRLSGAGIDAMALPLIDIAPPLDPGAVDLAWTTLPRQALVMFVSPTAVSRFIDRRPNGMTWPDGVLAGSTGPGTTAALRAAGLPDAALVEPLPDSLQFDSEALWQRLAPLRDWRAASVLVVRGDGGRDWLARALAEAGAVLTFVAAYRRLPPSLDADLQALLRGAVGRPRQHVWHFSSSEAIGHLLAVAPDIDWRDGQALASHPRIAERATAAGFGRVRTVAPHVTSVIEAIRTWDSAID